MSDGSGMMSDREGGWLRETSEGIGGGMRV